MFFYLFICEALWITNVFELSPFYWPNPRVTQRVQYAAQACWTNALGLKGQVSDAGGTQLDELKSQSNTGSPPSVSKHLLLLMGWNRLELNTGWTAKGPWVSFCRIWQKVQWIIIMDYTLKGYPHIDMFNISKLNADQIFLYMTCPWNVNKHKGRSRNKQCATCIKWADILVMFPELRTSL